MPLPLLNTLFALGVYLGNPDGSDPGVEQAFEQNYASFVSAMGTQPTYIASYIDNSQPVDGWVGNAGWQAWSNAQSPIARNLVPVISLQMSSTAPSADIPMNQFQDFASGKNDSVVSEIVDVWVQNGFKKLIFRVGTEMNIPSLGYAGDSAESQAMWVKAFKRVSGVLHREAKAHGISLQVVWNPNVTNYSNAEATTSLYPGDAFVDIIGADMYSVMWPYSDSWPVQTYHDWDTGGEDTDLSQFIADPVNREHYFSYPAATENCLDCSVGHAQTLDSLIAFALQHGKPFAIPECGSGNSQGGHDINDDPTFPLWLARELTTAKASGLKIAFVTIWDNNGGGNYHFSDAADGKPLETVAWQKYFGAQPQYVVGHDPEPLKVGAGSDEITVRLAEDAWQGDAQFTVSVDGQQVGGPMFATASYMAGQRQVLSVKGSWGTGPHLLTVNFLNDADAGSAASDRNLYVTRVAYNGVVQPHDHLYMFAGGPQSVAINATTPN